MCPSKYVLLVFHYQTDISNMSPPPMVVWVPLAVPVLPSCFCRGLWGVVVFICYSCRVCLVSLPLLPLSDRVGRVSPIFGRKLSANYRMAQHISRKVSANYRLTASNYRVENHRKRPFLTKQRQTIGKLSAKYRLPGVSLLRWSA